MLYRNPLENMIFVFGSNLAGRHGKGAAKFAVEHYGAKYGVGQGPTGSAYALPTKNEQIKSLTYDEVAWHCNEFLGYTKSKKDDLFQVTRIGCGLAGFTDDKIAPLFKDAPSNVFLPARWLSILDKLQRARLFVDGVRYLDSTQVANIVSKVEKIIKPWGKRFELVTDCNSPVSEALQAWACKNSIAWTPFPKNKYLAGDYHSYDVQIAWYCTHVIEFTPKIDLIQEKRQNFFKQEGLKVKTIDYPINELNLGDAYALIK